MWPAAPSQTAIEKVELKLNDGIIDTPHLTDDVEILQRALRQFGVLPNDAKIDGMFEPVTEAAVEQFQKMRPADPRHSRFVPQGLTVTGIVDRDTWAELLQVPATRIKMVGRDAQVPTMPDGFPAVDDILQRAAVLSAIRRFAKRNLPLLAKQCIDDGVTDRGQIVYVFATAQHESHWGRFMIELADGTQFEGRRDLGNVHPGDGPRFRGRGYVQITGRRNYSDWSDRLDMDLIAHPEKASRPDIAAIILVRGMRDGTFTGVGLDDFITANRQDFLDARRIVNGVDRVRHIRDIAEGYLQAIT